jgi:hypothetical protein
LQLILLLGIKHPPIPFLPDISPIIKEDTRGPFKVRGSFTHRCGQVDSCPKV